jgi:hypothetical protein
MNFDKLYPNIIPSLGPESEVLFEGAPIFKYGDPKPCWNCGNFTNWIDISFEAYLCSEECERQKWKEFEEAYNRATEKYGPPN